MAKSEMDLIFMRRRELQNPYAFVEQLEASPVGGEEAESLVTQIAASRELLENPYAYLDGAGDFSALPSLDKSRAHKPSLASPQTDQPLHKVAGKILPSYTDRDIGIKVKGLHELIWKSRTSIWGDAVPNDPVDMLDPIVALELIGYEYQLEETLGQYRSHGGMLEVAGLIDQTLKTVRVSRQVLPSVRIYTTAHELGHAVLHPHASGVHRDRPLDGSSLSREASERQADKFATIFLMPEKLVRSRFAEIFRSEQFVLNEETAFALAEKTLSKMQNKCKTRRDISRLLASVESYDGRRFLSLAAQFRVSVEAMAIRLEELSLLAT